MEKKLRTSAPLIQPPSKACRCGGPSIRAAAVSGDSASRARNKSNHERLMKTFRTACLALIVAGASGLTLSCRNESVDVSSYIAERDSIIRDNQQKERDLSELTSVMTAIAAGLDSIAAQEDVLLTNKTKDGVLLSKEQIRQNLEYFSRVLESQRRQIAQLEDSLKGRGGQNVEKMRRIIDFLNSQLAEKDATIQSLRRDLSDKNKSIGELRASIASLRTKTEQAEKKNEVLTSALSAQDEMINECYIKVGTKKELQRAGLLRGGFLSKKRVNYTNVDKSKFNAVDIRKFRDITLRSDNPKILTPMPNNSSFHFEDNGDGTCTLHITDPTKFWSVSNFLIIQL